MRRPFRSLALPLATAVLLTGAGSSGCKKEEKAAEPAADKAGGESASAKPGEGSGAAGESSSKPSGETPRPDGLTTRLGLEPITIAEVQPIVPALTGAQALGEPAVTAGGRRVTIQQCLEGTDLEKVRAELEQKLTALGYASVRGSPPGKRNLAAISAQKDLFRIAATLRMGPYPDCPADQKKVKVLLSFFKRSPQPEQPAPSGAPTPAPTGGASPQ